MIDDDAQGVAPATAASTDERRRARQAQIEADLEHGRQLAERYGREVTRSRFAVVGHAGAKGRRQRRGVLYRSSLP